ncbi:Fc.00g016160.m01.CDS01 [Cosmosporella sp. VM-42]
MNPQMGQAQPGQQQQGQQRAPPMYQPAQIRSLPTLTDEEKNKYEQGLQGLWGKANSHAPNTQEHQAAKQKIIEFSKMLINKIQQRRTQQQAHLQQQQQLQQQQLQQQQQQQQLQQQQQVPPRQMPVQQNNAAQGTSQAQAQQQVAGNPAAQGQNGAAAAGGARPNPQAAAGQRPKIPEHIVNHVNKITFRAPAQLVEKSGQEASKWVDEIRDRYGRALMTMENSKQKVAQIDKLINDRAQTGNPFKEEELRQLGIRKEQQLKLHQDAHKWVDSVRKQQGNLQGTVPAAQNNTISTPQGGQPVSQGNATQAAATPAQTNTQNNQQNNQNAPAPVNAAVDAAKQAQLAAAGRASPANGTPTTTQPAQQPRPTPSVQQPAQQTQVQPQIKTEPHIGPINPAIASAAGQVQSGTPTPAGARVQTPQAATPTTAAGPARALSHSAAMTIANQRAAGTPGGGSVQPQPSAGTPVSAGGAVNQGVMGSGLQQQQQGHPHAHPTQPQQQQTLQSKMPIPKALPDKATGVPQGVNVGGGVNTGRPTISQGSGTLGGVMNQPVMNRVPAYNHEAEGDHVLSKKKLDELVRQVCGGSVEGQEGNLLTPEVEENVLSMADSFVDNVLHAACRNSKERGSKVLEIRDIQLVLERTYNIRVPGYSSDELRTVRKIQPSAGWIAKMSAVQAAKVMPGKTE